MKINWYLLIPAFIVLSISCGGEGKYKGSFPETINVSTQQCGFDSIAMHFPYRVKHSGGAIYITDLQPPDFFCHRFIWPQVVHEKSFAPKGKGPGELTDAVNIIVHGDGTVYLLDAFARKIYGWDGENILMTVELPEELTRCVDFTLYNDSVFIVSDYSGDSRVAFVDFNGKIVRRMGSVPSGNGSVPVSVINQAWRPFIHYNPQNKILAVVTQLGEVLEIYNTGNDECKTIIGPGGEPVFKSRGANAIPVGIRGYSDVFVGESNIYAVFWGHEMEKIRRGEITGQGGNLIHVFDLDGNPVRRYELDRHITGFCVDENTGKVIGTDVNNEQLVMFDL